MIGTLRGLIQNKTPPWLLLEVNGMGYEIQLPANAFYVLPDVEQPIFLYTHLSIQEDAHRLYGFLNVNDRDIFRVLIRINGVGPKLALNILSHFNEQELISMIRNQDVQALKRVPGIGQKTAERLMVECRHIAQRASSYGTTTQTHAHIQQDAVHALMGLGYSKERAEHAVALTHQQDLSIESLIRLALKLLFKG